MLGGAILVLIWALSAVSKPTDPCDRIGGQKWVAPQDLRECFTSVKVEPQVKQNIIDVINKTLAFHTSVNYQIRAPEPFTSEVHENLLTDLARIQSQSYRSEYDLHIDLSRTLKRLNDGHCVWINSCYDSLYVNYLPIPLVLLTSDDGTQNVHIAPEAFTVASNEFLDQISVWQDALPGKLKGKLESLSGAKVLLIDGKPPFEAVDANALITGGYQAFGTRQKAFFSSYQRGSANWNYIMGNFAQQSLPLSDSVQLTIESANSSRVQTITLPYRARFNPTAAPFTDRASWRANNCVARNDTNGIDLGQRSSGDAVPPSGRFQQAPPVPVSVSRKHPMNVMLDTTTLSNVVLPPTLQPGLPPANGSASVAQFYMLKDGKTGVLALGSFSDTSFVDFLKAMLAGLQSLKSLGATQLIVDVSNNGGGFICAAHWLHRIIAGPKDTTVPQAGLDSKARRNPLTGAIVDAIIANPKLDPDVELLYNPVQWRNADNVQFTSTSHWLDPGVDVVINGRKDSFSPRLGQECQPEAFPVPAPDEPLFDTKKVVIVSNGRCGSSCSLFSITMAEKEGSKTVFLGGKNDVKQRYCGTVGGQSTDFSTIDTDIKTTHLKSHELAPPDLVVNGVQGITWRLAFGVKNTAEPAEWQDHAADLNLPLTRDLVNNPVAIWEEVARQLLS